MDEDGPYTQTEILKALHLVERDVAAFFDSLSDQEFVLRAASAWTPAQHLQHLNTAVSAVARGMAISPWLLRLRFGRARAPSRTFPEVRERYRALLAAGAGATGRYVPSRSELAAAQIEEYRNGILARWQRVNARLRDALDGWSERNLDATRLPHPILGRLTTREMLFFTIYHNGHHLLAARRRLPRFSDPPAG